MPSINIPARVRFGLYVLTAVGTAVVAYLFAKGLIGEAESGLWAALVTFINGLAAANTDISSSAYYNPEGGNRKILGKAAMSPMAPRKREDGAADLLYVLVVVLVVLVILALVGVL